MKIDAVILAKSTMWGKFCVAGIDIKSGMWVRFIGYGDGQPLDDSQMLFINDGGSCEPLDVARIRIARELPRHNHTEDYMIERDMWLRLGRMSIQEVLRVHPEEEYRFIFGNDREYVSDYEMSQLRHRYSLILIRAERMILHTEVSMEGKLKIRAEFIHHERHYRYIRVTDPDYHPKTPGVSEMIGDAYLVMSMPVKPFKGRYYKLVAKIFPLR